MIARRASFASLVLTVFALAAAVPSAQAGPPPGEHPQLHASSLFYPFTSPAAGVIRRFIAAQ